MEMIYFITRYKCFTMRFGFDVPTCFRTGDFSTILSALQKYVK